MLRFCLCSNLLNGRMSLIGTSILNSMGAADSLSTSNTSNYSSLISSTQWWSSMRPLRKSTNKSKSTHSYRPYHLCSPSSDCISHCCGISFWMTIPLNSMKKSAPIASISSSWPSYGPLEPLFPSKPESLFKDTSSISSKEQFKFTCQPSPKSRYLRRTRTFSTTIITKVVGKSGRGPNYTYTLQSWL